MADEPTKKLTIAEFAQRIKQRAPELAQVPDDELVRKVLERRPEMITYIETSQARPKVERGTPFMERAGKRVIEDIQGGPRMVTEAIRQSAEEGTAARKRGDWAGLAMAPIHALQKAEGGLISGIEGVSTPGLMRRIASGEDPAKIAADMSLMLLPSESQPMEAGGKMVRGALRSSLGVPMQELVGAGREPVYAARIKYQEALADWQKATGEQKVAYAEKVQKARADWEEKSRAAYQAQAEAERISGQKKSLITNINDSAERLRQNLQQTFQSTKSRLDERWNNLRATPINRGGVPSILKDELLDSGRIRDSIYKAEREYLQGAPAEIKQFRDLMSWMKREGPPSIEDVPQEVGSTKGKTAVKPITWDEARTHYTALGNRMYSGELPGNVRKAIRYVRDEGLGEQLRAGAGRANALDTYQGLLKDWSQYESDWLDTRSVARGKGSPLAIARLRPNGARLLMDVTGIDGPQLVERLGRYRDAGASVGLAEGIRRMTGELESLDKPPSASAQKLPAPFERPTPPKPIEPPTLASPADIRRNILRSYAGRRMGWWERMFPPLIAERIAYKIPSLQEAVSRVPRYELPLPRQAGGVTGMTPPPLEQPNIGSQLPPPGPRQGPFRPPGQGPFPMPSSPLGEPELEMLRRGAGGEPPAGRTFAQQAELVNNLRMLYERQRAAGLGEQYITAQKLRQAEEALPKTQGKNYTDAELAAYKKKWGIQ